MNYYYQQFGGSPIYTLYNLTKKMRYPKPIGKLGEFDLDVPVNDAIMKYGWDPRDKMVYGTPESYFEVNPQVITEVEQVFNRMMKEGKDEGDALWESIDEVIAKQNELDGLDPDSVEYERIVALYEATIDEYLQFPDAKPISKGSVKVTKQNNAKKTCNASNKKSKDDKYICNPETGRWVKIDGKIGKDLVAKYGQEVMLGWM